MADPKGGAGANTAKSAKVRHLTWEMALLFLCGELSRDIAVVHFDHTVIIDGGKWHEEGPNYMWDFVYYHDPDPSVGRNALRGAGTWIEEFCSPHGSFNCFQIISANASKTWETNYINYSAVVSPYSVGDPTTTIEELQ